MQKAYPAKEDPVACNLTWQERIIMEIIWNLGAVSVQRVYDVLSGEGKAISYGTVLTFMEILQKKGILTSRSIGSSCFYSPVLSRDCFPKRPVRDWLGSVLDRKPDSLFKTPLNEGLERG